jgi:curved DNA-binding protein CbpA
MLYLKNSKIWTYRIPRFNFSTKLDYNILYDPEKDYYKLLDIGEGFDEKELKLNFYSLSKKLHPDTGGDEEKYKIITVAYEILKDNETRMVYNKLRSEYILSEKKKADSVSDEFSKKEFKKDSFRYRGRYNEKRKYHYKSEEQTNYQGNYNQNSGTDNSSKTYKNKYNEYKYTFYDEADKPSQSSYEEYFRHWKDYRDIFYSARESEENLWHEFKINRKYKPTNVIYPEYNPGKDSRLHPTNRMSLFHLHPYLGKKYGKYFINEKLDPFKIRDDSYKLDKEFLSILNRQDDSEGLNSRITLNDMIRLYSKKHIAIFSSLLIFLYYLNIKL